MSYNYVVTAQRPTAVTHSLLAHFTSAQDANLITAKGNRLNILTVTEDGLQGIHDAPLYGSVACMEAFRLPGESQDLLFILTARYQFCILGYDTQSGEIRTRGKGNLVDRIGKPADVGRLCSIDPQSRLIALYLYEGVLKVIPIDARGNLKDAFNLRLDEFQVLDIQFLHGCSKPTLALLHADSRDARHLKTYVVRPLCLLFEYLNYSRRQYPLQVHDPHPLSQCCQSCNRICHLLSPQFHGP
eukprot:TRINITY_DN2295_c0_g1_i5.p2 TRINITY_DN2295_c0_g1~~TRINITY_DN2295_c0_g1_i5.p2  ORF type:complete len:243 (-),score=52.11 TRINITY_DN2295_c0_g1_i5:252-980(-)